MDSINQNEVKAEGVVYVIYHNPHTPTVANIKAAEIVQHPKDPNKLALFLNESFHLIEEMMPFFHPRLRLIKHLMTCMVTCFRKIKKRTNVLPIIIGYLFIFFEIWLC
jgi:transcriptional regulator of the spore photoproduct lyase operon